VQVDLARLGFNAGDAMQSTASLINPGGGWWGHADGERISWSVAENWTSAVHMVLMHCYLD
jgi:hypothetical protein